MIGNLHPSWPLWAVSLIGIIAVPWFMLSDSEESVTLSPLPPMPQIDIKAPGAPDRFMSAPLFTSQRVITNQDAVALADVQNDTQPEAPQPILIEPELVGVISGGRGRSAAILKGSDNIQQTLTAGETIDGWRITSIDRNSAMLLQNGQSLKLSLTFEQSGRGGGSGNPSAASQPDLDNTAEVNDTPLKIMEDNQ